MDLKKSGDVDRRVERIRRAHLALGEAVSGGYTPGLARLASDARDISLAEAEALAAGLRHAERRSDLLSAAGAALGRSLDVEDTAASVARLAVPVLGRAASVELFDREGALRVVAVVDPTEVSLPAGERSRLDDRLRARLMRHRRPIVSDASHDPDLGATARHLLVAPLRCSAHLLGALIVEGERPFDGADVSLAAELADRAALALDNARHDEVARRSLIARDELVSFVAHDLRNLVGTLVFSAEAMVRNDGAPDRRDARRHVDGIRKAAARMTAILDTLRDATMIEHGRFAVATAPGDLGAVLHEAVAPFRARAERRNVELRVEVEDGLPHVRLDHERVHQVLANLIGNALDHTPAAGVITVDARTDGDCVRVAVADTGDGIHPADIPHVFERYWRKDSAPRRGTGLGLFIARQIVEAHGGTTWVESEVGHGATFYFTLPPVDGVGAARAARPTSGLQPMLSIDIDATGRSSEDEAAAG